MQNSAPGKMSNADAEATISDWLIDFSVSGKSDKTPPAPVATEAELKMIESEILDWARSEASGEERARLKKGFDDQLAELRQRMERQWKQEREGILEETRALKARIEELLKATAQQQTSQDDAELKRLRAELAQKSGTIEGLEKKIAEVGESKSERGERKRRELFGPHSEGWYKVIAACEAVLAISDDLATLKHPQFEQQCRPLIAKVFEKLKIVDEIAKRSDNVRSIFDAA